MEKTKLDLINEKLDKLSEEKKPEKKFKLPLKARVNNRKLKEGYATIEVIGENKEIEFRKIPIVDGTIQINDTFHAVSGDAIFTYKGKPFIHQHKNSLNPIQIPEKNQTYGQKYVMARMKSDWIKAKKKIGWGMSAFGVGIALIIGYSILTGG